jgi:hypothetical protein
VLRPEDIKSDKAKYAREAMQVFAKAKKNLKLYPSNNPIYEKTLDGVHGKFQEFFKYYDRLDLKVTRNELLFENENIFHAEGKDENLALFFFRDGLRELGFKKGLDRQELQQFLEIVSVDFDREDVEDDIVTLLWEKDFGNISYKVDERILMEEDDTYQQEAESQAKEDACEEDNLKHAYEEAIRSDEKSDFAVMPVTDNDLKVLVKEMDKDSTDKTGKLVNVIFEILWQSENTQEFKDIANILNNAIEFSLRNQNLQSVVDIVRRAKHFYENTESAEAKKHLRLVFSYVSSSTLIYKLGRLLDGVARFDEKEYNVFIGLLNTNAIGPFIALLGDMKTVSGRKWITNALITLGRRDIALLAGGLEDVRPFVVRNIIYVMRKIGNRKAEDHLLKITRHADSNVRKDVLMALGDFGDHETAVLIRDFLNDPSESVRVSAARTMGKLGSEYCRDLLVEKISQKGILSTDFDEVKEYFAVLARWKDSSVIGMMMKIINRKHFFNKSKYEELKLCAVYCLGLIGSREPLKMLDKLRTSKNRHLSEYANLAIRRIKYGK